MTTPKHTASEVNGADAETAEGDDDVEAHRGSRRFTEAERPERGDDVEGHRMLSNYAKDVTAWAARRNDAAHGEFEVLSRERAELMVDAINLFMRRHRASVTNP